MSGGRAAVMFSELTYSKYLVYVAAVLLLAGVFQILVALFVFLSEALDIYMLVSRWFTLQKCLQIIRDQSSKLICSLNKHQKMLGSNSQSLENPGTCHDFNYM